MPRIYVQLNPTRLAVRHVQSGRALEEAPIVAIMQDVARPLGVGAAARAQAGTPGVRLVNPFDHPRSLLSDFTLAELVLKDVLGQLLPGAWWRPAPWVLLHPPSNPVGGYTQIEVRAMLELAHGAGAARAKIWHGRPLSDEEVLADRFPADGEMLA
jgi:rod shape-determining protein MreB